MRWFTATVPAAVYSPPADTLQVEWASSSFWPDAGKVQLCSPRLWRSDLWRCVIRCPLPVVGGFPQATSEKVWRHHHHFSLLRCEDKGRESRGVDRREAAGLLQSVFCSWLGQLGSCSVILGLGTVLPLPDRLWSCSVCVWVVLYLFWIRANSNAVGWTWGRETDSRYAHYITWLESPKNAGIGGWVQGGTCRVSKSECITNFKNKSDTRQ